MDSDALTISNISPAHGTAQINDANHDGVLDVVYTPTAGFIGIDLFDYTISDGHGGTDTARVSVRVDPDLPGGHGGGGVEPPVVVVPPGGTDPTPPHIPTDPRRSPPIQAPPSHPSPMRLPEPQRQ